MLAPNLEPDYLAPKRKVHILRMFNLGIIDRIVRHFTRGEVSSSDEQQGTAHAECWNTEHSIEQENHALSHLLAAAKDNKNKVRWTYAAKLARECLAQIPGVGGNTKANQLVATSFIQKRMDEDDVRITHRAPILKRALLFVRTPTNDDLEVIRITQTEAFVRPYDDSQVKYYHRSGAWLGNWFGERHSRPEPNAC
jgi:hypothetical protein